MRTTDKCGRGFLWSQEAWDTAKAMRTAGHMFSEIAEKLGLSEDAVVGRFDRERRAGRLDMHTCGPHEIVWTAWPCGNYRYNDDTCRFMLGEPEELQFCPEKRTHGAYCECHYKLTHRKAPKFYVEPHPLSA